MPVLIRRLYIETGPGRSQCVHNTFHELTTDVYVPNTLLINEQQLDTQGFIDDQGGAVLEVVGNDGSIACKNNKSR